MEKTRKLEPYEKEFLELVTKGFKLLIERREQEIKDEIARQTEVNANELVLKSIGIEQQTTKGEILPPVCTITDVMNYFQLSRSTVWRLLKSGEIKSYRCSNKPRVKREWLLEYEESLIATSSKHT